MGCREHSRQILCDLGVFQYRPVSTGRLRDDNYMVSVLLMPVCGVLISC